MSKALLSTDKRWQLTLLGILAYTALWSIPLGAWAMRDGQNHAVWRAAVITALVTAGGAIGATISWLVTGNVKRLAAGYLIGAMGGFIAYVVMILWFAWRVFG